MSTDQRPAETAARQHREDAAAEAISQLTAAGSGHSKAVMAGPEGYSVTDRTDPQITGPSQMEIPPVPAASSKHTGPP